ncbi:16S rRNA methyltransferase [Pseudoxanthomonas kalamensis DSM 18571]|uniref:class I SAM-dependent methyltransferase n=1 Tax=Pseudoxanthomonas kalamensis TaxID=289483 RepID=UPI001FE597E1|nr:methyltransferase [Pseudoxanthomonas kalamensis]KAF1712563.1 16S rRNA methyltransferase [Pseudoxanthomonas kalamensis DSM 18571]
MTAAGSDPALDALLLPFASGQLDWPQRGSLFLRARDGGTLHRQSIPSLVCEQSFKPAHDALLRSGLQARMSGDDTGWPCVLLLPPRQRDEARALFAQAWTRAQAGGIVVASMANDEGAKSGQADFEKLFGPAHALSKHKCRVFWARRGDDGDGDADVLAAWTLLDAPRAIAAGRFVSRPGVFAWDRIDAASALLAEHLPDTLAGSGADLGAGYGYLSTELLARCPGITDLHLYEAEARALDCARSNLQAYTGAVALDFRWHDVTVGLPQRYDFIVSNPPFHAQQRQSRPDIGRAFIAAAAEALRPRGELWLVANRQLPYEQVLDTRFGEVETLAQRDGFKVVRARRGAA